MTKKWRILIVATVIVISILSWALYESYIHHTNIENERETIHQQLLNEEFTIISGIYYSNKWQNKVWIDNLEQFIALAHQYKPDVIYTSFGFWNYYCFISTNGEIVFILEI